MSRHQRTRIREIDFRRPFKFSREQVRRIEHAHEGFTRTASSRMSASLRTEMQIGLMGADQLPYSTVMSEELPRQSLVSVLRVDPLDTQVALVMESPMALSLVDRMLGGTGTAPAEAASLTDVERAVSRRVIRLVVDALSATWLERAGVSFSIADIETSPSNVQIVPASEPTLLLNFSVTAE